jgi:hypothetical protein
MKAEGPAKAYNQAAPGQAGMKDVGSSATVKNGLGTNNLDIFDNMIGRSTTAL